MKNSENIKITLLSGDMRCAVVAYEVAKKYGRAYTWRVPMQGKDSRIICIKHLEEAIERSRVIILPLPASIDGRSINSFGGKWENEDSMPQSDEAYAIELSAIIDKIDRAFGGGEEKPLIIGGRLPSDFCNAANAHGILCFDYFKNEDFQVKNAYITAEGALLVAMESLKRTIFGAEVAVLGYGRIGKHLARLAQKMGARVTVVLRSESDGAWAELEKYSVIYCKDGESEPIMHLRSGYDVIFNTIPARILGEDFFAGYDGGTLLVELASSPGGISASAARAAGASILWAPSLPGRYAPESAGVLMFDCISKIIDREVMR